MPQPKPVPAESLSEWVRQRWGSRAAGILLTILVELMLALILLTLVPSDIGRKIKERTLTTFDINPVAAPTPTEPEPARDTARPAEPPTPQPPVPVPAPPDIIPPPPIPLPQATVPVPAPAPAPAPARPGKKFGPPNKAGTGDTPRVEGSGPNGEPLYAAAWYREPYDDELRGYLSTATGPGWGLIACRTVPNFRVEDCVALAEYPERSNIARAVLAAAWQFRVRPPQFRGQPQIGEWVRIRIDYDLKPR